MKPYGTAGETGPHGIFTEKQRRVLDLLIENKTSKEIARTLGISPYTVDQRISLARGRLGVSSRNELAARYRVMRNADGGSLADSVAFSGGEEAEVVSATDVRGASTGELAVEGRELQEDSVSAATAGSESTRISCPTTEELDYRVGPEVFEGSSGGWWRLGAIVVTALLLVMTILGLFAIFSQLNELLA